MAQCCICLQDGGIEDACLCPSTIHIECLAEYLRNGFSPHCPNCLTKFGPGVRANAFALIYEKNPDAHHFFSYVSHLVEANSPVQALYLLKDNIDTWLPSHVVPFLIEMARALVNMKDKRELCNDALKFLETAHEISVESYHPSSTRITILRLKSEAHLGLGQLDLAEKALAAPLSTLRLIGFEDRISVLRMYTDISKRQGNVPKLLAGLDLIYDDIRASEKDIYIVSKAVLLVSIDRGDALPLVPSPCAPHLLHHFEIRHRDFRKFDTLPQAHAELLLAKQQHLLYNETADLGKDLKVLRRRGPDQDIVLECARALAVRPRKRLRCKCHPEDIA